MRSLALATLFALGSTLAAAQAPALTPAPVTVAPMDCGATPENPGRLGSETQRRNFEKAFAAYDKCVRQYVEDRKAVIQANEAAAQKAVDNFNALVTKMRADSGQDVSKPSATPSAPTPAAPSKPGY
jgi:hypothetical protein